jgi:hypothetical protein
MTNKEDWRLTNQENYLKGVTLVRRSYRQYAKNPNWDHDHCDFCWAEFCFKQCEGALQEGYATLDDYHWICPTCFEDFKDMFEWKIIIASDSGNVA